MSAVNAAWFLGRATWRRRWRGLLGLGLLAGIVGGVVVGSLGGIRRSASAFDRLLDASDTAPYVVMSFASPDLSDSYGEQLAGLREVASAVPTSQFVGRERIEKNWFSVRSTSMPDGIDPVMVEGRIPAPGSPAEVIVSVNTSRIYGWGIGSTIGVDLYRLDQLRQIKSDSWTPPRGPAPPLQVVGIYREPLDAARSDIAGSVWAGEAFTRAFADDAGIDGHLVRLRPGVTETEFRAALDRLGEEVGSDDDPPPAPDRWVQAGERGAAQSENIVAIGLGAFAAVAALAGLIAHGQSLRRWAYPIEMEQSSLAALGATSGERRLAVTLAALPHVVLAVPVSVLVAYLMTPLFPFGMLADIEPSPGFRADWLVLGLGAAATAIVTVGLCRLTAGVVVAGRARRQDDSRRGLLPIERAGGPVPLAVGSRFVLRPGSARRAFPVHTAIAATVLAIAGITASLVFTASLDRLVETPSRYGIEWDLSLELLSSPDGPAALQQLIDDRRVQDVDTPTGIDTAVRIGGRPTKATVLKTVKGSTLMHLTDGRLPSSPDEVVLGPKLLEDLGLRLGGHVEVTGGKSEGMRFTVVGTALSPTAESEDYQAESFFHDDVDREIVPTDSLAAFPLVLVRFAPGVDHDEMAEEIDDAYKYALMNESFARPPGEITNIAQLTSLPKLLAVFLALLGFAALVHALVVTARSRRRDLGILRSLGFTRAQSAASIVAMTTTIVAIGVVAGLPLGLVVGTSGWRLVAQGVYVATDAAFPALLIGTVVLAAMVAANLVALAPARAAARHSTAESLRSE